MDKFGVFNLLNSLISVYEKTKSQNSSASAAENTSPSSVGDAPSALKSAPTTEKNKPAPPIQRSMIRTLDSHDAFVERVRKRNAERKST